MELTPRWTQMRYHKVQSDLVKSKARFKVVPAGRRSGKTERAKREVVRCALAETNWPDARYFCAAPTREQAKAIYWADLKALIPRSFLAEPPRETELTLTLVNGASIQVVGMDKPERIEGRPWNGGILDEIGNMRPKAWSENVRPALSDRMGWCWLIGVPEGRNHYYDLWKYAISGADPEWAGFTWPSSDILPEEEIEAARRQLDDQVFDQEYNASFLNFVGRAYYQFDEKRNTGPLMYSRFDPIAFCFDFNVDPGVAVVVQEQHLPHGVFGTAVIGEVYIPRNSTTPAVAKKLAYDWEMHQSFVRCYGDATGGARGSAKTEGSDWDLVRAELRNVFGRKLSFRVPSHNPAERSRVNAMNSWMHNSAGEVHMMIDPIRAPNVIKDLEGVRLLEGGSGQIDKKHDPGLTHLSDALGYYVHYEHPTTGPSHSVSHLRL